MRRRLEDLRMILFPITVVLFLLNFVDMLVYDISFIHANYISLFSSLIAMALTGLGELI